MLYNLLPNGVCTLGPEQEVLEIGHLSVYLVYRIWQNQIGSTLTFHQSMTETHYRESAKSEILKKLKFRGSGVEF